MKKTRVPDDLTDDGAMRLFLDQLDRRHIKVSDLTDLDSGTATATDNANKINAILAIFRTR